MALLILINVNVFALWYYVLEGPIWRLSPFLRLGRPTRSPLSRCAKLFVALEIVLPVLTLTVLLARALAG